MTQYFGVCDCGKYGEAPSAFNEAIHFLKCDCGATMFLHRRFDPIYAGYNIKNRIIPSIILIAEKVEYD
jgi:hypothetical protein